MIWALLYVILLIAGAAAAVWLWRNVFRYWPEGN